MVNSTSVNSLETWILPSGRRISISTQWSSSRRRRTTTSVATSQLACGRQVGANLLQQGGTLLFGPGRDELFADGLRDAERGMTNRRGVHRPQLRFRLCRHDPNLESLVPLR